MFKFLKDITDLKWEIKNLKEDVLRLKRENSCSRGIHIWGIGYDVGAVNTNAPYVRCDFCGERK